MDFRKISDRRSSRFGSGSLPFTIAMLASSLHTFTALLRCDSMEEELARLDANISAAEQNMEALAKDIWQFHKTISKVCKKHSNKLYRKRGGRKVQAARRRAANQPAETSKTKPASTIAKPHEELEAVSSSKYVVKQ